MIATQYVSRVTLQRDKVAGLDQGANQYPFNLPLIKALEKIDLHPKVTFLVGENGSGKSTLLEAIAVALGFNPEGGTKNFNFATRPSHSNLSEYLRIAQGFKKPRDGFFLRAETFYNVATEIDNLAMAHNYGGKSLHEQSHGESFLALMKNRFSGKGLYILDEPEAALSPQRQLAMLALMHELVLDDSQFIVATHSPILMAYPEATIFECSDKGLVKTSYDDTENVKVMRDFMLNPERLVGMLMAR